MAPNRIMRGGTVRRGLAAASAVVAILAGLAGCGGGGSSTTAGTVADAGRAATAARYEPSADAVVLNKVLGRQEAAVAAFTAVLPKLPPRLAPMAAYFRRQEQEHVDSILKVLRGLKSRAEPTAETIDASGLKDTRERLVFLYEIEGATIDEELSAISKLEASWPRSLLASTVADQGQHLSLLRRALGAGPLGSIPTPFENGTFPPPVG